MKYSRFSCQYSSAICSTENSTGMSLMMSRTIFGRRSKYSQLRATSTCTLRIPSFSDTLDFCTEMDLKEKPAPNRGGKTRASQPPSFRRTTLTRLSYHGEGWVSSIVGTLRLRALKLGRAETLRRRMGVQNRSLTRGSDGSPEPKAGSHRGGGGGRSARAPCCYNRTCCARASLHPCNSVALLPHCCSAASCPRCHRCCGLATPTRGCNEAVRPRFSVAPRAALRGEKSTRARVARSVPAYQRVRSRLVTSCNKM